MRFLALSSCALLLLGGVACSSADDGSSHTGTHDSEIINGNLDTTRQAVVTILSQQSACTGTIVAKDVAAGIGYVLTAAHCVTPYAPVEVRQGNDYANPDRVYGVISYAPHPAYNGGSTQNDVGMIRIAGVDASTPTLDVGFSSAVTNGMGVMSVGYGLTGAGSNTRRYSIVKNLNGVNSAIIQYSLSGGGICSGDSGGPVLSPTSGAQQVIAVHSSVDNASSSSCSGNGYSVRVSYHESFITSFINEQVEQTCDVCQQVAQSGACSSAIDSCINDSACYALVQCFNGCNDSACYQTCASNNAAGVSLYNAIIDCTCDTCATECAQECAGPACGFQFQNDTCTACHEANCCQQGADCADDAECTTCVTSANPPTTCADNAALTAWDSCLAQSCATECNLNTGGTGGTGGSGGTAGAGGSAGTGGSAGSSGGGSGGDAGSGGSAGAVGGSGGSAGTGTAGSGAAGSGATSQGGSTTATGGSRNDGGSSSSGATCTLSVANSGHGSGTLGGLMLLGMLGFGLRRRRSN